MNKYFVMLSLMFAIGCAQPSALLIPGLTGPQGEQGSPGESGANGHSLVSATTSNPEECGESGGSKLEAYLDVDDSGDVSEGDSFQSALVACNGAAGVQGPQGLIGSQGEPGETGSSTSVTITATNMTDGTCKNLGGVYGKRQSSSDHVKLYSSSTCFSGSALVELDDQDFYFLNNSTLFLLQDLVLRKAVFN